jgi:hypothetical protein
MQKPRELCRPRFGWTGHLGLGDGGDQPPDPNRAKLGKSEWFRVTKLLL